MNKEEEIIKNVEERVRKELEGKYDPDMLGYIHIFEKRKQEILKEEYGIEYETTRDRDIEESVD